MQILFTEHFPCNVLAFHRYHKPGTVSTIISVVWTKELEVGGVKSLPIATQPIKGVS